MPGSVHEGVLLLFQEAPSLLRELGTGVGLRLPQGDLVEDQASFSDLSPATYAADLVLTVRAPEPVASVVVEVQNAVDPEKLFAWPRYVASVHALRRCLTWLVVVATNEAVARWARRPSPSFQPSSEFAPLVLGPADVPRVTDAAIARRVPELAVLSAVVHGRTDDGRIGRTAMEAARDLDTERRRLYTDLTYGSLGDAARAALEAIMRDRNYEPLTEIGREMLAKGRAEGRAEGEARGRAEGLRVAIESACTLAGIPWTAARREAVQSLGANDLEALLGTIVRDRDWPSH